MLSTYHGHLALSRLLLSHNADPNRLNDRGQSPLAGAVFKGEGEIVNLLLESGADVDLGRPSAAEAVDLFKKTDEYGTKFQEARDRLRKRREGGVGGTKGATELA
jgi:ankyrin repeat protein